MKILIAINSLEKSHKILTFSSQIVKNAGEPPAIMHVTKKKSKIKKNQKKDISEIVDKVLDVPDIKISIKAGYAAHEITKETKKGRYELLITDDLPVDYTHFYQGKGTVYLIKHVSCPVIIVKGGYRPIRRILLCDSGAGRSSVLTSFTAQLASMLEGHEEVTVLHVMSQISAGPGVSGKQLRASADELLEAHTPEGELLEKDIQILERPGVHPKPLVAHGLVLDEILLETRKGDYDLVVIGNQIEQTWRRFLLEDLARKILEKTDRPVLVVK